jgi:hypothetical protein
MCLWRYILGRKGVTIYVAVGSRVQCRVLLMLHAVSSLVKYGDGSEVVVFAQEQVRQMWSSRGKSY